MKFAIQNQYLQLIKKGIKTIDGRIDDPKYKSLKVGDLIRFQSETEEEVKAYITKVQRYKSFKLMIESVGLGTLLPRVKSLKEGIKIYHSFPGYVENEKIHGCIAIHIEVKCTFPYSYELKKKKSRSKKYSPKLNNLFAEHSESIIFQDNELEYLGIIDMVEGLDYHYGEFKRMEKKARERLKKLYEEGLLIPPSPQSKNIVHEMVAYINRLGQLASALTSSWFNVNNQALGKFCPTIFALLPLRNKFGSHRSLDKPKGETYFQRFNHALVPFKFNWLGKNTTGDPNDVNIENVNIEYQINVQLGEWGRSKVLFNIPAVEDIEIITEHEIWCTFILTKHHHRVCDELLDVIKKKFQGHLSNRD